MSVKWAVDEEVLDRLYSNALTAGAHRSLQLKLSIQHPQVGSVKVDFTT